MGEDPDIVELSYARLPADARASGRALALHPVSGHDVPQAATVTGLAPAAVERLFDLLLDHNLAHEPSPGRLTVPPLLRDCAHAFAPPAPDAACHLTAVA